MFSLYIKLCVHQLHLHCLYCGNFPRKHYFSTFFFSFPLFTMPPLELSIISMIICARYASAIYVDYIYAFNLWYRSGNRSSFLTSRRAFASVSLRKNTCANHLSTAVVPKSVKMIRKIPCLNIWCNVQTFHCRRISRCKTSGVNLMLCACLVSRHV